MDISSFTLNGSSAFQNSSMSTVTFEYLTRLQSIVHHRIYMYPLFIFDIDLVVKVTQTISQYPLHHVTYAQANFEVSMSNILGGDKCTIKYIN